MLTTNRAIDRQLRFRLWQQEDEQWYPSGVHSAVEVTWVLSGNLGYRVGRKTLDVTPGAVALVPAQLEHRTGFSSNARAASLHLDGEMVSHIASQMKRSCRDRLVLCRSPRIHALGNLIVSEALEAAPGHRLALAGLADALSVEILRGGLGAPAPGRRDWRIDRVIDLIESCYAEPLSLQSLSEHAQMSRFHFGRVFRQVTGKSPYRYLLETRVHRAAQLLRHDGYSVTDAAFLVGFKDLGRFSRMFHDVMGCTPNAFRRAKAGAREHDLHKRERTIRKDSV